jgi:hypothetical protein
MKTTPTTTVSVEAWQLAHYLRVSADAFRQNIDDLLKAGYDSDHQIVKTFRQQIENACRIADAFGMSETITVENNEWDSTIHITVNEENL